MQDFTDVMSLESDYGKTGSVHLHDESAKNKVSHLLLKGDVLVGFLQLNPDSGNWIIDQQQVDAHVKQLRKMLASCSSIFSWIQTWNSCISHFFSQTFGQPESWFGRPHLDSILRTYQRIQQDLFGSENEVSTNVADYLKSVIESRFKVNDVPDTFLFSQKNMEGSAFAIHLFQCSPFENSFTNSQKGE